MLKGLQPGVLDELLTFEHKVVTRNSINEPIPAWTTYKQVYGQRMFFDSPEVFEARQETAFEKVKYVVRYDSQITSLMRFKQDSEAQTTYFYVRGVEQNRREGNTVLTAERRDNE